MSIQICVPGLLSLRGKEKKERKKERKKEKEEIAFKGFADRVAPATSWVSAASLRERIERIEREREREEIGSKGFADRVAPANKLGISFGRERWLPGEEHLLPRML